MVKNMEKAHTTTKMVIFTSENGSKIKKMVMVYYNIQIKLFMMDNGSMISHAIKDKSFIPIKTNIKVIFIY